MEVSVWKQVLTGCSKSVKNRFKSEIADEFNMGKMQEYPVTTFLWKYQVLKVNTIVRIELRAGKKRTWALRNLW